VCVWEVGSLYLWGAGWQCRWAVVALPWRAGAWL
jgi:hypothetical protein